MKIDRLIRKFLCLALALVAYASAPSARAKDVTFEIIYMNHTNMIVAEGEITGETPDVFQAFLDTEPFDDYRFVVALDSGGGSLVGGLRISRLFTRHRLSA